MNMSRLLGITLIGIAITGCDEPAPVSAMDMAPSPVARGRYLVNNVGLCTFCHTPLNPDGSRDNTRLLSGFDCFFDVDPADPNVGCISSRNLTSDPTGLKNATDQQIKDALLNGIRTDGKPLAPVMPYWIFHNLTSEDADAIVAYLRTLPPVEHLVQARQAPWDQIPGPSPFIQPEQIPSPPASHPQYASAMRGRYLSSMAGLCIDCHTPDAAMGSPTLVDYTRPFAGGRVFPAEALGFQSPPYPPLIYTSNLTPDPSGIQGWSVDEIKKAIQEGIDRDGKGVCAGTHGVSTSPYAGLDPQDLTDIATYLTTLPAIANTKPMDCQGP